MASSADDLRRLLEARGIRTVLIGAHAANRYRLEVRHTVDVDLLASSLHGAAVALREAGCEVREVTEDGEPYMLMARIGSTQVDVLLAETDYQRTAMDRAIGGVLTVEDVVVHKLLAGRPRDLDDIRSILAAGVPLDVEYIVNRSREWDVLELWNEISGR